MKTIRACILIAGLAILCLLFRSALFASPQGKNATSPDKGTGQYVGVDTCKTCHEILDLAVSESLNLNIRSWTFDTAIPAPIVIATVTVFLTIGIVMLLVVRDQVIQRKSIVTGNEVHALLCLALLMPIDLVAAEESVCEDA